MTSRQRTLVLLQSARSHCDVCEHGGVMRLVSVLGIPTSVTTNCPHCSPPAGVAAVEVRPLPMRDDERTAS